MYVCEWLFRDCACLSVNLLVRAVVCLRMCVCECVIGYGVCGVFVCLCIVVFNCFADLMFLCVCVCVCLHFLCCLYVL